MICCRKMSNRPPQGAYAGKRPLRRRHPTGAGRRFVELGDCAGLRRTRQPRNAGVHVRVSCGCGEIRGASGPANVAWPWPQAVGLRGPPPRSCGDPLPVRSSTPDFPRRTTRDGGRGPGALRLSPQPHDGSAASQRCATDTVRNEFAPAPRSSRKSAKTKRKRRPEGRRFHRCRSVLTSSARPWPSEPPEPSGPPARLPEPSGPLPPLRPCRPSSSCRPS